MSDCDTCPLHPPRRRFLGRMSAALALVFSAGLSSEALAGRPVTEVIGAAVGATEKRYPVPAADGVTIDADAQVILVRSQQSVYAFALACPHQNTALRWRADDQRFQCPKHESKYKPDGTFISGRATRNMDRLPIKRAGDAVIVDVDVAYKSDAQPAEWAAAKVAL
ncbi:MAG: ubiquinol-cytochrome c reductase iron-sulfur subunit [Vicinamibacteria bacterium]